MDNRKYIIYLGTCFLPDNNAACQRAYMICKSCYEMGYRPIIIGASLATKEYNENVIETFKIYNNFDCYLLPYPNSAAGWLKRLSDIKPIVSIIDHYEAKNIFAIIQMDYLSLIIWRLKTYCKNQGIHFISDSVDWFEKSNYRFPKNIIKNIDTFLRMRIIQKQIPNMIAISTYLYNYYKKCVKNIVLVPSTADIDEAKWRMITPYKIQDTLVFSYAGNPGVNFERERIDWMIKAVCKLNELGVRCKFIMAGFDKKIIELHHPMLTLLPFYNEALIFKGIINHIDCLNMISQSDFSVIIRPKTKGNVCGSPTKLAESFACQTPVLATPCGDIAQFIVNGVNGFICNDCSYDELFNTVFYISKLKKQYIEKMHMNLKDNNNLKYSCYNLQINNLLSSL